MSFFGVRYWRVLFWINAVLSVVHACKGSNMMFLAFGMTLLCFVMIKLFEHSTEN